MAAGGLRYEDPRKMPPGLQQLMALKVLEKLRMGGQAAQKQRKEKKELIYCKGKGGLCDTPCKDIACAHYDGTGAVAVPTVADRIRSMSNKQLAEAIMDLYLRISDPEFDLSELWCQEEGGCTEKERMLYCGYEKRLGCILRYLESYVEVKIP